MTQCVYIVNKLCVQWCTAVWGGVWQCMVMLNGVEWCSVMYSGEEWCTLVQTSTDKLKVLTKFPSGITTLII